MRHVLPTLLTAILVTISAPAAWAHADLVGTSPTDGSTVDVAPAQITLEFNEEPLATMIDVVITDADGNVVAMDAAEASGTQVSIPWPGSLGAGDYTVAYRVVSADGHPITGTFGFTFTGDASSTVAPVVDEAAAQDVLAEATQSSNSPLIIGAVALLFVAVAIVLTRRRTR